MAKLVHIANWLTLNPDHVTSVRYDASTGLVHIEMANGTRHRVSNTSVTSITDCLNGEDDA